MLEKTTVWLQQRLKLEVSEEKTKIVNLKKTNSYFLGFRFKLKKQIRVVKKQKNNKKKCKEEINKYNSMVVGIHEYYHKATNVSVNLQKIGFIIKAYVRKNFLEVLTFGENLKEENFVVNT